MITAIKGDDLSKLQSIFEKNSKKKMFKKIDPVLLSTQRSDIDLIKRHVDELEQLSKRKYERDKKSSTKDLDSTTSNLLEGADDLDDDRNNRGGLSGIVMEQDLPNDATKSNLPQIDISVALQKVNDIQKKIDEGLDVFSKKLDDLHQMSITIGSELTEQNMMLKNIDEKVDKEIDRLKHLNEKVDDALAKVGGSNKLMCIVCIVIIIVVMAACALIFLVSYF